ncbi:protein translocase subunit SecD [Actinomyces naeslundii]|uniref:Protein translocase subunit SecD n=1 Tax=Actinomyces naeslundii TaxID=1655 RepID=A0AA47FF44_ACTNA|nr:protein translocase subunit SecD [Actinomyces naeslundii]OMG13897.1 protein-export membrane protein SecD [Actinomyces naeslundii]OMG16649.1 protein-export membrane protein SecD [Actinomyces naeslundii]PKY94265.1 protein translocase subunit SecD [Actinomyces naeslundii]WAL42147.1 protein translocase subunit SecD [Actinomyces naeslundii]
MSSKQRKRPGRRLLMFILVIIIGFGALVAGTMRHKASLTPGLALDLEGGTQIILTPTTSDGSAISDEDVEQAIEVIRQRVDASGVSEAQISRQGGQNIVVSLPGKPSQATLELVRTSAVMYFRPVLRILPGSAQQAAKNIASQNPSGAATSAPTGQPTAQAEAQPDSGASGEATQAAEDSAGTEEGSSESDQPTATPAPSAQPTAQSTAQPRTPEEIAKQLADVNQDGVISSDPLPATSKDNSSDSWITEKLLYDGYMTDCSDPKNLTGQTQDPKVAVISCSKDAGSQQHGAYILGPADITGTELKSANSGLETDSRGQTTNKWVVSLAFNPDGTKKFSELSKRLLAYRDQASAAGAQGAQNPQAQNNQDKAQFAIVLDGLTIMASGFNQDVHSPITDGRVQITGNFNQNQANTLANQLSFGSLPLSFTVQSEQQISATLGTEQLRNGLIAGLIGFGLIILYLAWQYRGLAVVAVASLAVAAAGTYLVIAALSATMGYRLSLAGVAGLIISIGITVDSFIIYFERVRDEVRQGRTLRTAIDEGWKHARRTILVSDAVNLVAAIVLYFLAVGGVQGFAFTLGVTTCVDLAIIIFFTHPFMEWIIRFRFFGEGHRLSGLDPEHLGATSSTYGKGREAVADRVAGSLARRKAEARRASENPDEVTADDADDDSDDTHDVVDEAAEQGEVDAIDVAADGGKDGETK